MARIVIPEPADCLAALVQRRAECEELRAEVARLREALRKIAKGNPTCDSPEADAAYGASIARAALTDGGGE
jgi:hypothetical protein